jgi:hypothetical protein
LQLLNSVGEEIAVSANPGNSNESIHLTDLPPDTYIIGVYTAATAPASNFVLRASNNTIPDLLARENLVVPNLTNSLTFSGIVSDRDTSDLFRFQLPSSGSFQVDLTELSNSFNSSSPLQLGIRVIRQNISGNQPGFIESDEILASTSDPATGTGTIFTLPNQAQGSYWIQVYAITESNSFDGFGSPPVRYSLQVTRLANRRIVLPNSPSLPTFDVTEL